MAGAGESAGGFGGDGHFCWGERCWVSLCGLAAWRGIPIALREALVIYLHSACGKISRSRSRSRHSWTMGRVQNSASCIALHSMRSMQSRQNVYIFLHNTLAHFIRSAPAFCLSLRLD